MQKFHTVVELESFLKRARAIMSDKERAGIVTFPAANPEVGISLGGGLRKVRRPRGWRQERRLSHALRVRRHHDAPVPGDGVRQEREG